jgi:hypothetical protein
MKKFLASAAVATALVGGSAFAQTSTTAPAAKAPPPAGTMPAEKMDHSLTLTDDQAKNWINKAVYSSDGKNIGEVAAFTRDASGKVTEMHADIGGFLGIGETRVRVMPAEFKLMNDRVVLNLTGDQAKNLPKVAK